MDRTLAATLGAPDDPRVRESDVRILDPTGAGRVVLVGVVHGHPASAFRVGWVLERAGPDVLALELPAVAVPAFERRAADPAAAGGEMTAAIAAAEGARVVGIDMPSRRYLRALAGDVRERGLPTAAAAAALRETLVVTRRALRCRLAGRLPTDPADATLPVDGPAYDCGPEDPPEEQAAHEASHLARCRSILRALERPAGAAAVDRARERAMAHALERHREAGDVVAVVGFDHLEAVAERLANASS